MITEPLDQSSRAPVPSDFATIRRARTPELSLVLAM
jgi:hypothetical protein